MAAWVRTWQAVARRAGVATAVAALLASAVGGPAQAAGGGGHRPRPPLPVIHPARGVTVLHPKKIHGPRAQLRPYRATHIHWPAAASGTAIAVGAPAPLAPGRRAAAARMPWSAGTLVQAGKTPVQVQLRGTAGPGSVRVHVLSHAAALAAGIRGVVFTAAPGASTGGGTVRVSVDYAGFAQAYGGNYGLSLGLLQLPACALTTPVRPACRAVKRLNWANDWATQTVSAPVQFRAPASGPARAGAHAGREPLVLAVSPSYTDGGGPAGTYSATTLRASGTWAQGGSSGSFSYSYPIQVPPAASSLVPQMSLDYDSGTVDGQTAATQQQASWVGDGWSVPQTFIEQSFSPCQDNPEGSKGEQPGSTTSDDCYDGPVLTLSLDGTSTPLVCPPSSFSYQASSSSTCVASADNGEVITHHVPSASNKDDRGTQSGDYWTLTTRDGTTYYFGLNQLPGWSSGDPETNSVDSLPVFSAHSSDPCYNSDFDASVCTMAYRWNLDYVTDVHSNAMAYYYKQDTNAYVEDGTNGQTTAVSYVRDSYLDHIDYGFTDGNAYTGHAPDQMTFQTGNRCGTSIPGSSGCGSENGADWPDVPWADECSAGASSSCAINWPTFWSTKLLDGITTQQWDGTSYTAVDSWALTQAFPPPGDNTSSRLWLSSITHTGSDTTTGGSSVTLPSVQFPVAQNEQTDLPNRVSTTDGPPLDRYRLSYIETETGSVISVSYELTKSCMSTVNKGFLPSEPSTNDRSCFPVYWGQYTPGAPNAPDWFNKYAVQSVTVSDPTGGSPGTYTVYKYSGAAWHYDDNEIVKRPYRTYAQWRGYQDVTTSTGTGNDAQTKTETTYYQGMDGDPLPGDTTSSVTLTDSQSGKHTDSNQLAGNVLENIAYNFDGSVNNSQIYSYWVSPAAATRDRDGELPPLTANATGVVEDWERQALTDTSTTTWRDTETDTTYDTNADDPLFGLPLFTFRHGDLSDPSQQACTSITYAKPNTAENLAGLPAETETDALPCGGSNPNGASAPGAGEVNALTAPASVSRPAQVISDTRTFYDAPTLAQTWPQPASPTWPQTTAPTVGDASVVQQAKGYSSGGFTYQTAKATVYDSYGRPVDTYDANGNLTTTSYTMTNGVTTQQVVTNPLGQATTTGLDPLRGIPVTVTDPNGLTTTLEYDGLGRLTDVWGYGHPDTGLADETYSYQVSNSGTQPSAAVTARQLNAEGVYVTSTTLYDALLRARQTQTETPLGGSLVSDYFYDSRGWLWKTNTNVWVSGTSPGGQILSIPDSQVPDQAVTSFDALGRPVLVQSLDDSAVKSETASVYYGDRVTTAQFDPASAQCTTSSGSLSCPAGATPSSTVTDALGRQTELDSYTTDPTVTASTANNVTTVGISGGTTQATTYGYDTRGWLGTITDAATGEQWTKKYNPLGEVTSTSDPNSGTTQMSYDPNGNLTGVTDADNNPITYTYDALNRKTAEYDGSSTSSPLLASWVYDNANNVVPSMSNPVGHLTTETSYYGGHPYTIQQSGFNNYGEPLGETDTFPAAEGALAGSYTLTHSYTALGGLPYRDTYPASPDGAALPTETVTHTYTTGLDLPSGLDGYVTDPSSNDSYTYSSTAYNAFSQPADETLGAGSAYGDITDSYDPHTFALTESDVTSQGTTSVDDTKYTYNAFSQITAQTDTRTTSSGAQAETQCFGYDSLGRLTRAWTATDNCAADPANNGGATVGDQIPGGAYWTTWKFDPLGDQTTQNQHSTTGGTNTVTTDAYNGNNTGQPNTLTATSTTGPAGTSTAASTYDADGNTLTRNLPSGNQTLTWTDDGKLATDTTPAGTTKYIYDADGTLLLQKDPGQTTVYLFGGAEQLVLNTATSAVTGTRFLPLPGGGTLVRTGTSTSTSYELTDQHNTSLLTLDNTVANPVWRQFTPYGAPRGRVPASWPDTNGFLGKPTDTTTGLTTLGARQYDPTTGRFLSVDPVLDLNNPQQFNGYTYANGDSVNSADPTGLCPSTLCGGIPQPGQRGHRQPGTNYTPCGQPGGQPCQPGTSAGGGYTGWLPGASVLPPQARPVYAHFMDNWQPWYGDVGIRGLLSSLDTFCGNNINLCGSKLTSTIWTTYLAIGGIGAIGPESQRMLGRLVNALLPPNAVAYGETNEDMLGRLPPFTGYKTSGIFVNDGNWTEVSSGFNGPAARIPTGTPGFSVLTRGHAEGHAAAIMRNQAIEEATVYLNNAPCYGIAQSCDNLLPAMLPEGAQLRVVAPGFVHTYTGLPDDFVEDPPADLIEEP